MDTKQLKADAKQASIVATVVTAAVILLEMPVLYLYVAIKWVTAFAGACMGIAIVRLVSWLWNRYVSKGK